MSSLSRQPVLFLSHGAPILADDELWTRQLAEWSADLPKPKNILMVSAHFEASPVTLSSTTPGMGLLYDFWGFPEKYYHVRYDAPPAADLADQVIGLLGEWVLQDPERGLDHGAYVPLVEMFPDADVPILQLSLPTLDPHPLFKLGQRLAPLRDAGTLIIGSGFTTHNLRWFKPALGPNLKPATASVEFDLWAAETLASRDVDAMLDFARVAPAAREAHPRTEHWAPIHVAMGAASDSGLANRSVIDGFWYGLSKRSWQFS